MGHQKSQIKWNSELFCSLVSNLNHFSQKLTKKNSAMVRFQFCGNNTEKTINFWLNLMVYTHVRVRHNVLSRIILWGLSKFVFKNNGDWCWGRGYCKRDSLVFSSFHSIIPFRKWNSRTISHLFLSNTFTWKSLRGLI